MKKRVSERHYRAACEAYARKAGRYALHNAAMEEALEAYEASKVAEQRERLQHEDNELAKIAYESADRDAWGTLD